MPHKDQIEEERRRAAQAQMPPPTQRPAPKISFSVQRTRAEAPLESPGVHFGPANQVVDPVAGMELQMVRRAARVAELKQVLDNHVPDRESNNSRVVPKISFVISEASGSRQESFQTTGNGNGNINGNDAKASRVVREDPVVKAEASGRSQNGVKTEQDLKQRVYTSDCNGMGANVPIKKEDDEEQESEPKRASPPEDDNTWAHRLWTTYFEHPPDPWWYDRDWRSWYGNGR
jgi:hypothetical protein